MKILLFKNLLVLMLNASYLLGDNLIITSNNYLIIYLCQ